MPVFMMFSLFNGFFITKVRVGLGLGLLLLLHKGAKAILTMAILTMAILTMASSSPRRQGRPVESTRAPLSKEHTHPTGAPFESTHAPVHTPFGNTGTHHDPPSPAATASGARALEPRATSCFRSPLAVTTCFLVLRRRFSIGWSGRSTPRPSSTQSARSQWRSTQTV